MREGERLGTKGSFDSFDSFETSFDKFEFATDSIRKARLDFYAV